MMVVESVLEMYSRRVSSETGMNAVMWKMLSLSNALLSHTDIFC